MKVSKLVIWSAVVSAIGFGVALFFLWDAALFLLIGVVIGFVGSVIRAIHMDSSLSKLDNVNENEIFAAKVKYAGGIALRMLVLVAALALPVLLTDDQQFRFAGILGAFIGLLSLRIAAISLKTPRDANKLSATPRPKTKGGEDIDGL